MIEIDLRSDTVTRPTPAMRRAMAEAEVGDDVYGEDPTVRALEERVAGLLGTEAALFVPTGTMANQIALRAHTRPGDLVMIGKDAHCWLHESGALAALAGAQTLALPGDGRFTADAVRAAYVPDDPYRALHRVVAVENTHNMGGGAVWDRGELARVVEATHALGLIAHLDGARLWNAAVATGASEAELARGFDSISVCLSKGLGAPVGSLLASNRAAIAQARRLRKMLGGGMRQVGVLAAAGLWALEHNVARLAEDHENARLLASRLARCALLEVREPETNIVMIDLGVGAPDAEALASRARAEGVLVSAFGPRRLRAVTHLDVGGGDVARAAETLSRLAEA